MANVFSKSRHIVVGESEPFVDVVVSLSEASASAVTVNYATADGTADDNGFDFETLSGTLNFAAGETTKTVRIQLSSYQGVENLEYFNFTLSAATNASIPTELGKTQVWIVDNDTVVDTPNVFVKDIWVDESGTANFIVGLGNESLGQSSVSTITVDCATVDGSAVAGSDFVGKSGTLTFAPGESVKTVSVDLMDDALSEGLEHFALKLSNATNAAIMHSSALATIGANDAGSVSQPILSVAKDQVVSESYGYIDVLVSLSAPSQNVVTVNYATADGTADDNGFDETLSGTLNFAAGETTKTVRIQLSSYQGVENLEYFNFTLSAATNASIPTGLGKTQIWIVDNDTVVDTPNVFVKDIWVDEKSGTANFIVRLGNESLGQSSVSTITVDCATVDGSAVAGSDFVGKSGTLTFAPGESVKTVSVDLMDDALSEGLEHFALKLSNATNAAIMHSSALATIGANDAGSVSQPILSVAKDLVVSESYGYIDVLVSLSAPVKTWSR